VGPQERVEDRWQRSGDLTNSGVHRVKAQILGVSSHEDARLRKRDRRVSAFRHLGYRELEARGLGVASSKVMIVRGCDREEVPIRWEKVSID
jgi:hypothetical protein